MKTKILFLRKLIQYIILTTFMLFEFANSQVPTAISVQGILTDTLQNSKPDGDYKITFKLYKESLGGTPVWECQKIVALKNGIFSVVLGENNEPNLPNFDTQYWLGLQLEGEAEMSPRLNLVSTPYSFRAIWSDSSNISRISNWSIGSDSAKYSAKSDTSKVSNRALKSDTSNYSKISQLADTAKYLSNMVLPIGTILPYAGTGSGLPGEWIICDGRALSSSQYPQLYQAIGKAWGDGTDDGNINTNFNIPDLRGMFLRGVDESSRIDPDAEARQSLKSGGNFGAKVGSMQMDMAMGNAVESTSFDQTSSFNSKSSFIPWSEWSVRKYLNVGANETRPINVYVTFIIKVK